MKTSIAGADYSAAGAAAPLVLVVPPACAGLRLDQALARLLPQHSRNRLAQWVREHRVTVEGRPALPRDKLAGGEAIRITPADDPRLMPHRAQDIALDVVFEDASILVVDKPAGLVVHPGSGNWEGTLLNALLQHAPVVRDVPRAGIVHRLDKETSGLLVVAKTLTAQTDLVRQLQARTVTREYAAIVHGRLERAGTVEAPIGRHPVSRTRMAVVARGKPAVTHYRVIARYAGATLLCCRLETGRTHQIRVHLASIAHPLVGDPVYGKRAGKGSTLQFHRQALHAQKLGLIHPQTGEPMSWTSPLPADMQDLIARLEAHG